MSEEEKKHLTPMELCKSQASLIDKLFHKIEEQMVFIEKLFRVITVIKTAFITLCGAVVFYVVYCLAASSRGAL